MARMHWMGTSLVAAVVMATSLAGCDHDSNISINTDNSNMLHGGINIHDGKVRLHADGSPDAVISASGDLSISDRPVDINADQRNLLQQYYRNALAIREHGIETGKAGAAIAGQAISSVAKGIASGDTDQIDKDVKAKTDIVKQTAMKICGDLAGIKTAQDALVAQLPAFKPYESIVNAGSVKDCENGSKD